MGGALLLAAGAAGGGLVAAAGVARADSARSATECTGTSGGVVAVDFQPWGGSIERGCDPHPTTALALLHTAGFTTVGTAQGGPAVVCRIGAADLNGGTRYPTPADVPCDAAPPPSASWSRWIAPAGQDTWTYSPLSPLTDVPRPGEAEAWVFGATRGGGTSGGPSFTPGSVRATTPAGTTPAGTTPATTTTAPATPAGGTLQRGLADQKSAASGAGYLVRQLTDGTHLSSSYGPDYGLTADLALALAASGGQDTTLAKVDGYLVAHIADYADPAGTSAYPGPYTGSAAKLAVLAEVTGQDPASFGGFDLLTTLTDHVCTAATKDGSCTAAGDFSQAYSTVSQSLGVLALARAGITPPTAALRRLDQLQCADGGFASTLIVPGADCASDVDTTGYAVQALSLLPAQAGQTAAGRTFLVNSQVGNGGFPGAAGVNANSTALAVQALIATAGQGGGRQAAAGQKFLATLQNSGGGFRITAGQSGSDTRSTTQAVPALAGTALTTLTRVVAPGDGGTGGGGPGTGTGTATPPPSTSTGPVTSGSPATSASTGPAASTGPSTSPSRTVGDGVASSNGNGNSSSPNGGSGGSLAATGTGALALASLAAVLLAVGGVFTAARRGARPHGRHR